MIADVGLSRYALLVSSIAGRSVAVAPDAAKGPAWTDGVTIFVNPESDATSTVASLIVQASLLSAGSLDADVVQTLNRRPRLAHRYLAVEGHRAVVASAHLLPRSVRLPIDENVAASSDSPASSLTIAASRTNLPEPPAAFGSIRPAAVHVRRQAAGSHDSTDGRHAPRTTRSTLREMGDIEAADGADEVDLVASPVGGAGAIGRFLKRLFADARGSSGGPPGTDAATRWSGGAHRPTGGARTTMQLGSGLEVGTVPGGQGQQFPEWDVVRRRYRANWCTVREMAPPAGTSAPFEAPSTHVLRRQLARIGLAPEQVGRQLQGIDVDIDAAVDAHIDHLSGSAPSEAVYVDVLRRRRDLAVLVLLDISGSANEPSGSGGIVHDHQRSAAVALTEVLHQLGDRVALYAFRSQGREAVQVLPLKRFDEPARLQIRRRIADCDAGAYTRLGAAIRYATGVIDRQAGTSRRLLVLVSDGFAYDHGYEGAYGEADARRSLAEARRRGIGALCLSVGAGSDPEALRRVFGTAAHAGVDRVAQLTDVLGPMFAFAQRSAETQRRTYQRKLRATERLVVQKEAV